MDNENFITSNVHSISPSIDYNTPLNTNYVIDGNNPNMLLSPEYGNKEINTLSSSCITQHYPHFPPNIISTIPYTSQIAANVSQLQFPHGMKLQENFEESPQGIKQVNKYKIMTSILITIFRRLMLNGGWMNTQIHPEFATLNQAETLNQQGQYLLHNAKPRKPRIAFECFFIAANFGSQKGKHQAVELYLEIANSGNPISASLCQLGICFQMGIGVQADATRAIDYYERAVHMGNQDAMFNLAYCLRYGVGTAVDNKRAYNIYLQLAHLGDPQGMKFVGNCKLLGLGTNRDKKEAIEWFKCSSKSDIYWGGRVEYALNLLNDGTSVNTLQNRREAFELLRSVCESFPTSPGPIKLLLGKCFHFSIGCQEDYIKALYWYQEAIKSHFMPLYAIRECHYLIGQVQNIYREPLVKKEVVHDNDF
ncbi:4748_t:CDS:2 [Entrophospora sp. SA101]|nr:3398_t:CDS:2 [Entrophospora sp. SA101]CAJ0882777.1 4748_t:CDS:2 [Entrophospora sp. SA101]